MRAVGRLGIALSALIATGCSAAAPASAPPPPDAGSETEDAGPPSLRWAPCALTPSDQRGRGAVRLGMRRRIRLHPARGRPALHLFVRRRERAALRRDGWHLHLPGGLVHIGDDHRSRPLRTPEASR